MSDVVHKVTLEYLRSVNTPDYPKRQWFINPELPDCEKKYWKTNLAKTKIVEMTAAQKRVVDNALIAEAREGLKEQLITEKKEQLLRNQAITELIAEDKLNEDGTLKE